MTPSLGEIEALARKAARGAGLPWGLAEEAGRAARWLAAHGVDALPALADLLDQHEAGAAAIRIVEADGCWRGADGPLCPVALGAALVDHAWRLAEAPITVGPVQHPELLAPFVAWAGRVLAVTNRGDGILIAPPPLEGGGREEGGQGPAGDVYEAAWHPTGRIHRPPPPNLLPPGEEEKMWSRLEAYAARTTVPASDQSRRRGAGAGLVEDD